MAKTIRNIPKNKWMREPRHKHKLLAGESRKQVTTNWDDKPISARRENKHRLKIK